MDAIRRMLVIAYDDAQILDIACPCGAWDLANRFGADPGYAIELVSVGGGAVRTSAGIPMGSGRLETVGGAIDTLMVVGGPGADAAAADGRLLDQVRRVARRARRIAAVCTGASLLAAAGLLDGRRVTTHWAYGADLTARYPEVAVDTAPLYVRDGDVYTSAGVTSALDLTLSLIADDHGSALARAVARELVTHVHRPADQAQLSMYLAAPPTEDRLVDELMRYVASNLAQDLSPRVLAARGGVSTRHLSRLFLAHLGVTPARAVRAARAEAAAHLVRHSDLPLAAVARRCGFASAQTLRAALYGHYGMSGDTIRKMADMPVVRTDIGDDTPVS